MDDKKLDQILQEWNDRVEPSFNDFTDLKGRILDEISELPEPEKEIKTFSVPRKYVYFIAAVAAIFTICGVIFYWTGMDSRVKSTSPDDLAALSAKDVAEIKVVAKKIRDLFPEGVRWISKINNKIEIKTGKPFPSDANKERILIRYVVLKKQTDGWKKIHLAEIITSPGESINLTGCDNSGYVWTHQLEGDLYALDSRLKIRANGKTLELEFSGGAHENMIKQIKPINYSDSEYLIYQTVRKI